jgi:hypothetical protein
MSFKNRTGLCTCCWRHVVMQLVERRSVRLLATAAALGLDLFIASRFGWL